MEKRVILAFVLSFAVLYAFRALYAPPAVPKPQAKAEAQAPPPTVPPPAPGAEGKPASAPTVSLEDTQAEKAEDLSFDTSLYTATIANTGGVIKSFRLKAYTDGEGKPLELINQAA